MKFEYKDLKDELSKAFENSPVGLTAAWILTLSRAGLTIIGFIEVTQNNWLMAAMYFGLAGATDADGTVARHYGVTTKAGAIGDSAMDFVFRVGVVGALAVTEPLIALIVTIVEIINLIFNASIQKNRKLPFIPLQAKYGTAAQVAGIVLFFSGMAIDSQLVRTVGVMFLIAGTALRLGAYGKERLRMKWEGNRTGKA